MYRFNGFFLHAPLHNVLMPIFQLKMDSHLLHWFSSWQLILSALLSPQSKCWLWPQKLTQRHQPFLIHQLRKRNFRLALWHQGLVCYHTGKK